MNLQENWKKISTIKNILFWAYSHPCTCSLLSKSKRCERGSTKLSVDPVRCWPHSDHIKHIMLNTKLCKRTCWKTRAQNFWWTKLSVDRKLVADALPGETLHCLTSQESYRSSALMYSTFMSRRCVDNLSELKKGFCKIFVSLIGPVEHDI